jgi:hypothetical protein
MRRLVWLLPIAFFFLNPNLGCGGPEFQYGAAEMRAAIEGDWSLMITPEGAPRSTVTWHLEQGSEDKAQAARGGGPGLVRSAHACGTRTLVQSAGACSDSSQMPLAVTMVSGDPSFTGEGASGMLSVLGLTFVFGEVELTLGDRRVHFTIDPDGIPRDVRVSGLLGTAAITHTGT